MANATSKATFGTKSLTLNLELRRPFAWDFTIADVHTAILGTDFLSYHGLILDLQGRRLLDGLTRLSTDCTLGLPPQVFSVSVAKPYAVVKGPVGHTYDQLIARLIHTDTEPGLMAPLPGFPIHHRIITMG